MKQIWAGGSILLSWLGLAGLADNLVEWRDFFGNFVAYYTAARSWLFGFLPWRIPELLADYFVVGSAVSVFVALSFHHLMTTELLRDDDEGAEALRKAYEIIKARSLVERIVLWPRDQFRQFKYLFGHLATKSSLLEKLEDAYLFLALYYPVINVVAWPVTLLNYREFYVALYKRERAMVTTWFLLFWLGLLGMAFVAVDFERTLL